jgi:hypothetical protein
MKRAMVLVTVAVMVSGCAGQQLKTASTWEMVDQEPIFEMLTTAKDSFGYEIVVVKTFQRTPDGGVKLIQTSQSGGYVEKVTIGKLQFLGGVRERVAHIVQM